MVEEKKTYTVMDSKRGKTFATLDEANAYEREHRKRTGEFVAVVAGTKAVTHTYGVQATPKKTPAKKTTAKATPKKPTAKKPTKGKPAKSKPVKQTPKNKAKKTGTRKTTANKK